MTDFKDIKQPFSLYDLFGYILPGFFFYALLIIDFDGSKIIRYYLSNHTLLNIEKVNYNFKLKYLLEFIFYDSKLSFGIIPFVIFLIFCYLTGHIMGSFSSFLSKHLLKRYLKQPTDNLFPDYENIERKNSLYKILAYSYQYLKNNIGGIMSLNYKRPFDKIFIEKYKSKISKIYGYEINRHDYYWLTYTYICTNYPYLQKRVQHFVNLSGFSRNVAGTFLFYILNRLFIYKYLLHCPIDKAVLLILSIFLTTMLIMLWTYLRLHKRQAVDMYFIFMSLKIKDPEKINDSDYTSD